MLPPVIGVNRAGRDLVVGDVHGCFWTLDRALSEFGFDPSRDRLFAVGDLVSRGPRSEDALPWLQERFHAVCRANLILSEKPVFLCIHVLSQARRLDEDPLALPRPVLRIRSGTLWSLPTFTGDSLSEGDR